MKDCWEIRKAEEVDAPALEKCMHAAYRSYTDRIDPADLPPLNVDYADEVRECEVWIAEAEARLVGALILVVDDDHLQIANIAVHPEFQGKGLGRGLLDFAEKEAMRLGVSRMSLATHPALEENLSLYRYLGWTEFERGVSHVRIRRSVGE